MKEPKRKGARYKMGAKTAKSDMHSNNRCSVFGSRSISMNPLDNLLFEERLTKPKGKRHVH